MPRKRFTNEQIAFALRQAENGATVDEVCRKMGVTDPLVVHVVPRIRAGADIRPRVVRDWAMKRRRASADVMDATPGSTSAPR